MIHIDFQAGAHGNYLEFVCNTVAGLTSGTPFNSLGAAHNKRYQSNQMFFAEHYSYTPIAFVSDKIVSIQISTEDLLPLQQVSLLRAGDYNYDNNELSVNTYHKLNNDNYRCVLDTLINSFFKDQLQTSYNAVKDAAWPDVASKEDYLNLPQWIRNECENVHHLTLLELSPESPNCPQNILREFFKIGFQNPNQHGFMIKQNNLQYSKDYDVFVFPYNCFYHEENFFYYLKEMISWTGLKYTNHSQLVTLHQEFLSKQPYKNSKQKCDQIVSQLVSNHSVNGVEFDLLEQAYINSKLSNDWFV